MLTQSIGVVECDVDANHLVVTDTLSKISRIESAVEDLDARGRKVIIQAKLIHIALNEENLGGVDWSGIVDGHQRIRLLGDYDFLDAKANDRLLSLGLIEERHFLEDHHHYKVKGERDHHHLLCLGCGKVIEFELSLADRMKEEVSKQTGFAVLGVDISMEGYCDRCRLEMD